MIVRRLIMALLLLMAFVVVPAGGTHLHLCFDGQEPPVSVHVADTNDDHHAPPQVNGGHDDLDVSLLAEVVGKKFDRSLDEGLPVHSVFAPFAARAASGTWVPREDAASVTSFSRSEILPPLRGPPV